MTSETLPGARTATPIDEIVATAELAKRPARVPDYRAQSHALAELAQALAIDPSRISDKLVRAALSLTAAESAGLSLEEGMDGSDPVFRWVATAGEFERYLGGTLPRFFSPCGTVVSEDAPMLMVDPQRVFPYVADLHVPCREVLLAPFHKDGAAVGTLWAVFHSSNKQFDAEDRTVLVSLSKFAEIAIQTAGTLEMLQTGAERDAEVIATARDEVRLLKEWFEHAPGFCARLRGRSHVFEAVNEAYVRLVGERELIGRPVCDALPELVGQEFEKLLDEVYLTGQPYVGRDVEVRFDREGGDEATWIDFVYQPIRSSDGSVEGVFVQGHDVTEGHVAIERLREADRNKDEFVATLAHELRNPLSPIKVGVQVLKRMAEAARPDVGKVIDIIDRQTSTISAMIDGLMDIAAIRTGKLTLSVEPTNLQSVAARSLEVVEEALSKGRHQLRVSLPPDPVIANADPLRLTQALTNLLANAAKYTPEGGVVTLSLAVVNGCPTFVVADTGQGIAANVLPHIFDVFMQGSSLRTRTLGGLGIGLAVVKRIVELHGGGVTARSAGTDQGSQFTMWLPSA